MYRSSKVRQAPGKRNTCDKPTYDEPTHMGTVSTKETNPAMPSSSIKQGPMGKKRKVPRP
jgi:hypothetical protein